MFDSASFGNSSFDARSWFGLEEDVAYSGGWETHYDFIKRRRDEEFIRAQKAELQAEARSVEKEKVAVPDKKLAAESQDELYGLMIYERLLADELGRIRSASDELDRILQANKAIEDRLAWQENLRVKANQFQVETDIVFLIAMLSEI